MKIFFWLRSSLFLSHCLLNIENDHSTHFFQHPLDLCMTKYAFFQEYVITTRIRRMGEGNSFSLLVCPQGGVPTLAKSKVRTPPHGQGTYPLARSGWGVPQGIYPPARSGQVGQGTPRYLPPPRPRYLPPPAKLHGGRYASCVHAGRLYCWKYHYINIYRITAFKRGGIFK